MANWDWLFGKKGSIKALPTGTSEQQALMGQLLGGLGATGGGLNLGLQNLQQMLSGSPQAMEAFRAPAMRQFQQEIVPGIAERFSGMGAGAQGSSAFANTLGQAGAGLAENLNLQKANLQQNAMSQLMNLLGMSQQPQFQYQQMPGTEGALAPILSGIGTAFGGPVGAALGQGVGSWISNMFKGGGGGLQPGQMWNPQYGTMSAG